MPFAALSAPDPASRCVSVSVYRCIEGRYRCIGGRFVTTHRVKGSHVAITVVPYSAGPLTLTLTTKSAVKAGRAAIESACL